MIRQLVYLALFFSCPTLLAQNIDSLKQVISTSNDAVAKVQAYQTITNYYTRRDSVEFKKYLAEGLLHARDIEDRKAELELAFLEPKRAYGTRDYRKVVTLTDSLMPLVKAIGHTKLQTTMLNYSGNALSNLSDYSGATVKFLEYLAIAQTMEDNARPVAMASNNVGMAFLNMERYDQAIPYLQRSLENQKQFDSGFKADTYWNLGICYMEKRNYDDALTILRLGVEEAERQGNGYAAAGNQLCIGSVYLRQDRYDDGIAAYTLAYDMSTKANLEPYKLIEALNGLIFAHNQMSRPQEANKYVQLADSITDHHQLSDLRNREFLFYKSANLFLLGRPMEADSVRTRYSAAIDSLYSAENLEIIQAKETEFRTKEKEQMLELQEAELDFQRLLTTLLAIGAVLLLFIGFLVYRQQRLKIKNQRQEQALNEALHTVETNKKLEDQRLRIARELHDNIGSQLTYLASAAQNIGVGMKRVSEDVTQNKLSELSDFSQEAIADLRDTIWVMNRGMITWDDLAERIRYLTHKVSNTTGIETEVTKEGEDATKLNPTEAMNVFRIVQEAVNNAVKHAEASKITIQVAVGPPTNITVSDDGKGYDEAAVTSSSSGLQNMKSRASKLGGDLSISSGAEGTQIQLRLPVRQASA